MVSTNLFEGIHLAVAPNGAIFVSYAFMKTAPLGLN